MCKINIEEIKRLAKESGKSLTDLSKELGMSANYLSVCILRGKMDEEVLRKFYIIVGADFMKEENTSQSAKNIDAYYRHGETTEQSNIRKRKGEKMWLTPLELEMMFSELRGEENERELLERSMAMKIVQGDETTMLVPIKCLHFIPWQRNTNVAKAMTMAISYRDYKYDCIKCVIINEKLYIVDGGHRALAYYYTCTMDGIEKKLDTIKVKLINATEEECMEAFLEQDICRTPMNPASQVRAALKYGVPSFMALKRIANECSVNVVNDYDTVKKAKGVVNPTSALLRYATSKPELLKSALTMINKLEWNGGDKNAFAYGTIKAMMNILELHANDVPSIENKLMRYCKGATYYNNIIANIRTNAGRYDKLIQTISM